MVTTMDIYKLENCSAKKKYVKTVTKMKPLQNAFQDKKVICFKLKPLLPENGVPDTQLGFTRLNIRLKYASVI